MKKLFSALVVLLLFAGCTTDRTDEVSEGTQEFASIPEGTEGEWITLFDGTSLEGWTANENKETFSVEDGAIKVDGPRSHLFYTGPVGNHEFKNFEWKADIMTRPGANSGMYIHTAYQEEGWPTKGYEIQVNNTHTDPRKTAGLYAIDDNLEAPANDNEWFTQHIIVNGKRIITKVNDQVIIDYTEPDNPERPEDMAQRLLSSGTIAIQGHDPESVIFYKNIQIKLLEDG